MRIPTGPGQVEVTVTIGIAPGNRRGFSVQGAGPEGSFIQHWAGELLYYSAPPWVFIAVYTGFALLVLAAWFTVPPRLPWRAHQQLGTGTLDVAGTGVGVFGMNSATKRLA